MDNLFKFTDFDIFPIDPGDIVYVRGVKISALFRDSSIDREKFTEMVSEAIPGTKILDRYLHRRVSFEDYCITMDLLRDLTTPTKYPEDTMPMIYLTDINSQARFISKTFQCVCSSAQIRQFRDLKHPIKTRLKLKTHDQRYIIS